MYLRGESCYESPWVPGWGSAMVRGLLCGWFLLVAAASARAGDLAVSVVDGDGHPVQDAVVSIEAPAGSVARPLAVPAQPLVVDQVDETFVPYVMIAPRGTQVVFRNSDTTRHQVYSFSPPRPFQLITVPGETSPPMVFDQDGVVVIGCNIHDQMIAYLYVTDRPWAAQTGADGVARFAGLADGSYQAHIWQPRLRPGHPEPVQTVVVAPRAPPIQVALSLMPPSMMEMGHADRERSRY